MRMHSELIDMLLVRKPTTKEVLLQFKTLIEQPEKELEKLNVTPYDLVKAKNEIIGRLCEKQIEINRKFVIETPFENPCKKCKGTGEQWRFSRKEIEIDCPKCNGEGGKEVDCRCAHTSNPGKYVRKIGDGVFVKPTCKFCNGTLKRYFKCDRCQGKKKVHIWVIDRIEHRSICDVCNGRGYFPSRKKKFSENAVIPTTLGDEIKAKMKEAESQKAQDTIDHAAMIMINALPPEDIFWLNRIGPFRTSFGNPNCPRPEEAV